MARISEASRIYLGGSPVARVYKGNTQVWKAGIVAQDKLIDQWLARDAVTIDGARIPTWTGRVNGVAASQATESSQPRGYNSVAGLPALLMAGSLMNTPPIAASPDITVFVKALFSTAPTSANNSTMVCQDSGGNVRSWHCGVSSTKSARFVSFNAGVTGVGAELAGTVPLGVWQIVEGRRNGDLSAAGTITAANNGTKTSPVATGVAYNGAISISVGARGAYTEQMNGYITEIRIYSDRLSDELIAQVRAEMGI